MKTLYVCIFDNETFEPVAQRSQIFFIAHNRTRGFFYLFCGISGDISNIFGLPRAGFILFLFVSIFSIPFLLFLVFLWFFFVFFLLSLSIFPFNFLIRLFWIFWFRFRAVLADVFISRPEEISWWDDAICNIFPSKRISVSLELPQHSRVFVKLNSYFTCILA